MGSVSCLQLVSYTTVGKFYVPCYFFKKDYILYIFGNLLESYTNGNLKIIAVLLKGTVRLVH